MRRLVPSPALDTLRIAGPGIVAVAATYVFFLLYAQFGFLRLLEERTASLIEIQQVMAAMGLSGLATSLATAWLLRTVPAVQVLRIGLAGGMVAPLVALGCQSIATLSAVGALIGAATALATVALASRLRTFVADRRVGLWVGLGTGVAYWLCNWPFLFEGSLLTQSLAAALACAAGLAATTTLGRRAPTTKIGPRRALRASDFEPQGFVAVLTAFLALIWLDSTAFAVIQHTPELKVLTWAGSGKVVLGFTHLAAALMAGWLVDRGRFHSLLVAAFALFAVAFRLLTIGEMPWLAGPLYATGISFYSVALVLYPSYRGDHPGRVSRALRAAVLFGIAGWLGSALGVGLAQELDSIPTALLMVAGALLLLARVLGRGLHVHPVTSTARRSVGVTSSPFTSSTVTSSTVTSSAATLILGLAALVWFGAAQPARGPNNDGLSAAERGRQVYIAEGCIGCHSQYVRPLSRDIERWGPASGGGLATNTPPLYGNRRQGPDLTHVGIRRSATWHQLHLISPRSLMPESRMPSYAHLFDGSNRRGDDLVAYLASLGISSTAEWAAETQRTSIGESFRHGDAVHGRVLFDRYCAMCHGSDGQGQGPLAPHLYRPNMDLTKGRWWAISWGPGSEPEDLALARVVKYGLLGTSMPGHETLPDRDIADLVAWVQELSQSRLERSRS